MREMLEAVLQKERRAVGRWREEVARAEKVLAEEWTDHRPRGKLVLFVIGLMGSAGESEGLRNICAVSAADNVSAVSEREQYPPGDRTRLIAAAQTILTGLQRIELNGIRIRDIRQRLNKP